MDKTETEIRRGAEAEHLLANPLLADARAHIEAELWRLFKETPPQDAKTLEFVRAMQYFHDKYNAYLMRVISDGKVALVNLQAKKSIKERFFG